MLPALIRISFRVSSILNAGGSGDAITAQEESLGKVPFGATRTRNTPSRKTVRRTFAAPAVSSTPSFRFSTRWTLPTCCQPCATASPHPTMEASTPIPMRRTYPVMSILPGCEKRIDRSGVKPTCAETIRGRPAVLSREPLFKKRARFGAFHPASHGIHHAATDRSIALMEAQPIREMQLTAHRSNLETSVVNLEKALLENDTQDFVAEKFRCTLLGQSRPQPVAAIPG